MKKKKKVASNLCRLKVVAAASINERGTRTHIVLVAVKITDNEITDFGKTDLV